uniref:DUF7910 domain-containing protein n=1 Tax=Aegilops tauschii TaxID=37682 RepID=M8ATA8_AEGTA
MALNPPMNPVSPRPRIRAVNLGGWLVTEGWILRSLFDGIPNKDLLDGTQLQFKSVTQNAYVAAEQGGGTALIANWASASGWATFKLWRIDQTTFNFKVFGNQFVGVRSTGVVVATVTTPGTSETLKLVRNDNNQNRMRLRAPNGLFLQANKDGSLTADFGESEWVAEWKVSDAMKEDYQRFANAQMDVYQQATFGWAYWTYKNVNNHWSMEWMIKNGYISLTNA